MNVDEVEHSLPNGFHDAHLERMDVDWMRRTLTLRMQVDVSKPDVGDGSLELRPIVVTISGLVLFVVERPGAGATWSRGRNANTDNHAALDIPASGTIESLDHSADGIAAMSEWQANHYREWRKRNHEWLKNTLELAAEVPEGCVPYYLFANELNAFILFAGTDARLEWA